MFTDTVLTLNNKEGVVVVADVVVIVRLRLIFRSIFGHVPRLTVQHPNGGKLKDGHQGQLQEN